jgi:sec-independent protein translocase protein TatB
VLNLDPSKLLIIAVVAVILLGPDKLPQVARQVGAAWRSFGEFRHRMESEVRSSIPDLPSSADIARLARSPSALLNHLSNMAPAEGAATPTSDPTSDDPPGDEHSVPGSSGSFSPDASPGPTDTPTDSMPPTPSTPPTPPTATPTVHPAPGPAPASGDPSLN